MDEPTYTEDEANAKMVAAIVKCREDGSTSKVIRTGINDTNVVENFSYTALDVIRLAGSELTERNRRVNRNTSHTVPTELDYELKREACPLNQTFRRAWTRYERSR